MANENSNQGRTYAPMDFARAYQHGFEAARLSESEEGLNYIQGALTNLYQHLDIEGPAEIYKKVMDATPEAMKNLIAISSKEYGEQKKQIRLSELYDWFAESISSASEELRKVRDSLGVYLEKTLGKIEEEIEDSKYKLNPRTGAGDEEKEVAKKAIKERQEILGKMNLLENYSLEKARQEAVKTSVKPNLERMLR